LAVGAKVKTLAGEELEVVSLTPAVVIKAVKSGAQAKARRASAGH
jgi:hypothetical protein